jgi:hypothetical protein
MTEQFSNIGLSDPALANPALSKPAADAFATLPALRRTRALAIGELKSAVIRASYEYWLSKCRAGQPPRRADIDPVDVPKLLPYFLLKDVLYEPLDFRYRIVGAVVRAHSRASFIGRLMSDVPDQDEDSDVWRVMQAVVEQRKPALILPPYVGPHKQFRGCEAAVLPLLGDEPASKPEQSVAKILIAVDFLPV